ncbi:MAG: SAM-dependent methyltransferase [Cyanobacteriota bacterium]|nr:SAM-dependent methyltransferase [Cyanobacteriota bacterium]
MEHQRLTFAQVMEALLYHPDYGYYTSGQVKITRQGDFLTAPELTSDFGELLAEQLLEMWQVLGCPRPFSLIEMGSASGKLAADILTYLEGHHPEFAEGIAYGILEKSAAWRPQQEERLAGFSQVRWLDWEDLPDQSVTGCFFANELVDAFPVHRLVVQSGQVQEIYLTLDEQGSWQEVTGDPSTPELMEHWPIIGMDLTDPIYPDGYHTEVNLGVRDWLRQVAAKLSRGYLLTIDYGYSAERYYHPSRSQGSLLCYRQHTTHTDYYQQMGSQDLTAHVDFTALQRYGEHYGLRPLGLVKQDSFLAHLGLLDRIAQLSHSSHQPLGEIWQRRHRLHSLMDPLGLGGFWVLLQGRGLTANEHCLRGFQKD